MKKILFTILQFVAFFVTFFAASFLKPLNIHQTLSVTSEGTRIFIWDGVALMLLLFVLILLVEQARGVIRRAAPLTIIALALAAAAGYALKLGFLTT
jgi:hypothetical protein